MNTPTTSVPGLSKLYWCDLTFRRAVTACGFGLLVAAGIWWLAPVSSPDPSVDLSFEIAMGKWVPPVGLMLSAVGMLVLAWRRRLVKKILTEGTIIKGVVEKLESHATRTNDDDHAGVKPIYRHSWWATVRYMAGGREWRVTLRLPGSGFSYGLAKDGETELSVLDSKPGKPLIRAVYLGQR